MGHIRTLMLPILGALLAVHSAILELCRNPLISYILFGTSVIVIFGILLVVLEEWRQGK